VQDGCDQAIGDAEAASEMGVSHGFAAHGFDEARLVGAHVEHGSGTYGRDGDQKWSGASTWLYSGEEGVAQRTVLNCGDGGAAELLRLGKVNAGKIDFLQARHQVEAQQSAPCVPFHIVGTPM
jgi:hypothetical protein